MASEKPVLVLASEKRQCEIHSASVTAVITCRCGNPVPIVVHFIPGVPLHAFCPQCQVKFKLGRFIFDIEKSQGIHIGISEIEPDIVLPRVN